MIGRTKDLISFVFLYLKDVLQKLSNMHIYLTFILHLLYVHGRKERERERERERISPFYNLLL